MLVFLVIVPCYFLKGGNRFFFFKKRKMSEHRNKSPFVKSDDKKYASPFHRDLMRDVSPIKQNSSNNIAGDLYPSLLSSMAPKISNPNMNTFQVMVRLRSCSAKGFMNEGKVLHVGDDHRSLVIGRELHVKNSKHPSYEFVFDRVFDEMTAQEQLYQRAVHSLVSSTLRGINSCVLVYGQTRSGKSYTLVSYSILCSP